MTIRDIIGKAAGDYLARQALLAYVLDTTREHLIAHPEQRIPFLRLLRYYRLLRLLRRGHPLAYLTGKKEFYGLEFAVTRDTLIPRPETEQLVELAIAEIRKSGGGLSTIIDVGTGSGAIIVALAHALAGTHPSLAFIATDTSAGALRVAKANAKKHGLADNITFLEGNLLEPTLSIVDGRSSMVIANLPYLTREEMSEPSIHFEPKSALYGGEDGLDAYRALFSQLSTIGYRPHACLFEIGSGQGGAMKELTAKYLPGYRCEILKDYCGLDRIAHISR